MNLLAILCALMVIAKTTLVGCSFNNQGSSSWQVPTSTRDFMLWRGMLPGLHFFDHLQQIGKVPAVLVTKLLASQGRI